MLKTTEIEDIDLFYEGLSDDKHDGLMVLNRSGQLVYISATLCKLLHHKKKDLFGKSGLHLVAKEEEGDVIARFLRLTLKNKKKSRLLHRLRKKDGSYLWVKTEMHNKLRSPNVRGIVCYITDVSIEKEAEEEFNLVYEESSDAIFVLDYFTKEIKGCNSQSLKLFERKKKSEFLGKHINILWNDVLTNRSFSEEMEALDVGMIVTKEQEYYTNKANKFWGNTSISVVELPTSRVYLLRIADMRDQLKESRDYELAINQFAASLINSSTENEIVWDIASNIQKILKFEDCVIYTTNQEGNKLIRKAQITPPKEEDRMTAAIEVPFGQGIAGSVAQSGISEIVNDVRSDKRYVFDQFHGASEIAVPIIYEDILLGVIDSEHSKKGFFTSNHLKVLQTVASFAAVKIMQARSNIRLVQSEQKLQVQNEELKKINAELDRFVYSTSHDLRAPLANIAGLIEIMRYQSPTDETVHCLDLMDKSINKLDDFITDILRYSRNKRVEIKAEKVDFKELVDNSLSSLGFHDKSVKVKVKVDQKFPFISDQYRIQIILNNLISNSYRYRKDDDYSEIEIKVLVTEKRARISVSDNGIGIDKEHLPKIFDMFYRATNKTSGSGLGLFIVKETIELLKGKIKVDSKVGEGTTFELEIPGLKEKKG